MLRRIKHLSEFIRVIPGDGILLTLNPERLGPGQDVAGLSTTGMRRCGRLEHDFPWVRCESCHAEHLVAFSCNAVASAAVWARDAWPRVQRCWSMKFCPNSLYANGF